VQSTGRYRVEGIKSELGATNQARRGDRFKLSWAHPISAHENRSHGIVRQASHIADPELGSDIGHGVRRHVGRLA